MQKQIINIKPLIENKNKLSLKKYVPYEIQLPVVLE